MSTRDDVLQFLRDPRAFSSNRTDQSRDLWLRGLKEFAEPQIKVRQDWALRPAQISAWEGMAEHRAALLLGPPGTGKTFALSWMAVGYLHARMAAGLPCRILVTGFTLNSIGNLLDAIQEKASRYFAPPPDVFFLGSEPAAGLASAIKVLSASDKGLREIWRAFSAPQVILGCSVWSLYKLIAAGPGPSVQGRTSPLFDLVSIDEASQMVVGHGLLALAGLGSDGRVLVAGDNKQLSPIRQALKYQLDGRDLGGSLYDFLKSANVPEFPLEETFRLNAPLTVFPEQRFYPGIYRSAKEISESRLELRPNWSDGLADWEKVALDPEYPICILLHDGPVAGTHNAFEVSLAARLTKQLWDRMLPASNEPALTTETFWSDRLAIISPHRAQNIAIRAALEHESYGRDCVVETVDRVQGKERDAVIATYTVADPEFALAEGAFIFSAERLNVTITRAKTKLIFVISRRLLDAIPADEDVFDGAQTLREFAFSTELVGKVEVKDPQGYRWPLTVRVRRFNSDAPLPTISSEPSAEQQELPLLTDKLKELFAAIQKVAAQSPYRSAADFELKKLLYAAPQMSDLVDLMRLGMISLRQQQGPSGSFWVATPLDPARIPFSVDLETVRKRIEEVIEGARKRSFSPFYTTVRDRFAWTDSSGADLLAPSIDDLVKEGKLVWGEAKGSRTIDIVAVEPEPESPVETPAEQLRDHDFHLLNLLEDIETRRINFGVFESWVTIRELAEVSGLDREAITESTRRLKLHGHLMEGFADRVRSRMAELAREVRYVKQRFKKGDAATRPYLVRAIKVENKNREKPTRNISLLSTIESLKKLLKDASVIGPLLNQLGQALCAQWKSPDPLLAGFQARSLEQLVLSWLQRSPEDTFVVSADTGSGKTEAACLPLILGSGHDYVRGFTGTRAILVYPRIRLSANQAQRMAGYLAALTEFGFPPLSLGIQNGQVPSRFANNAYLDEGLWAKADGGKALTFPFFACPRCGDHLLLYPGVGVQGSDQLTCLACGWQFKSWIGSKEGLRASPPSVFLIVTESLHQWMHDPQYGKLFGDLKRGTGPRAVLADEIHLYSHTHGAEVGFALRRVLARAELNNAFRALAIGMSATLSDAPLVWGTLCGREKVSELAPTSEEREPSPRGREYFYFVQPEVESRGHDVAGAATTIQSLMCMAHGMRRRTGKEGGYRGLVFLDSIDKLKRLHSDYQDAEEQKRLAKFRTYLFDDDPGSNEPRTTCCGEPTACDRFREGECWFFAANDDTQWTATGRYRRGRGLTVSRTPIFSGSTGRVEKIIRESDLVFATSTLEVGYDDPDMTLVYQHYAPLNLASFVQRKGRGGRGQDDRPVTGVTLSVYSPRDSWYFRRPRQMFESTDFQIPLNLDNVFVIRGQALASVLDAISMWVAQNPGKAFATSSERGLALTTGAMESARNFVEHLFGPNVYSRLGVTNLTELLLDAFAQATSPVASSDPPRVWRDKIPWIPATLFETINLPILDVQFENDSKEKTCGREDIMLALSSCAPGNMTRRYGLGVVHWIPPVHGLSPLLSTGDYARAKSFALEDVCPGGLEEFSRQLPMDIRQGLGSDIHPRVCRPTQVEISTAGRMDGAGWVAFWGYDKGANRVLRLSNKSDDLLKISNKSRGSIREFLVVQADAAQANSHPLPRLATIVSRLESFVGSATKGTRTGLKATHIFWGADIDLRLEDFNEPAVPMTQFFRHPQNESLLLHGYRIETEGVRLHLNTDHLSAFVDSELSQLQTSEEGKWLRGRFFRYTIESRCIARAINSYEAQRVAELLVTAAAFPELRQQLTSILARWDSRKFAALLINTFERALRQHPLLTGRRVAKLAENMSGPTFKKVLTEAMAEVQSAERFRDYVRSVIVHGLAIRLKQLFILFGRGDEQRVLFHTKLPLQFGADANDIISVLENGEQGDGTTRGFLKNLERAFETWKPGALSECPNALEDAIVERVFQHEDLHDSWKKLDPREERDMERLGESLGLSMEQKQSSLQSVTRLLYGHEAIHSQRFEFFDLCKEIRSAGAALRSQMVRSPSIWELVSQAVRLAGEASPHTPKLTALLEFYRTLEDASVVDSLSPESRLADQVYRLSASLCIDGCPACLHTGSDIMTGSLAEASTSRRLLERFSRTL